jgi:hypothetical protein
MAQMWLRTAHFVARAPISGGMSPRDLGSPNAGTGRLFPLVVGQSACSRAVDLTRSCTELYASERSSVVRLWSVCGLHWHQNWRQLAVMSPTRSHFVVSVNPQSGLEAALGEGQPGLPDAATLESVVLPITHDGQRAPGLRFGEPLGWFDAEGAMPGASELAVGHRW